MQSDQQVIDALKEANELLGFENEKLEDRVRLLRRQLRRQRKQLRNMNKHSDEIFVALCDTKKV